MQEGALNTNGMPEVTDEKMASEVIRSVEKNGDVLEIIKFTRDDVVEAVRMHLGKPGVKSHCIFGGIQADSISAGQLESYFEQISSADNMTAKFMELTMEVEGK